MPELADGIGFVMVAMGMFGSGEIVAQSGARGDARGLVTKSHQPDADAKRTGSGCIAPILRGTALGSALGILPGGGAMLASFAAYSVEKKISKNSAEFGKGAIEGVAAPESANNAGAQTSFIPMLTLGIPAEPGHGPHDRRHDHPGHPARALGDDRAAGAVLGRSSSPCGSATFSWCSSTCR